MSNPFGEQYLPKLEVPQRRPGRVRDTLRPRRSGFLPGDDRQIRKGDKQSHNPRRLRLVAGGEKQDQRAGQTGLPRKAHRTVHDSHHATTHFHRETLQNERVEGRSLLQRPKARPQGRLQTLPLRRKGRGEKNFRNVEEQKVRPVRNPDGAPVHA